MPTSTRSEKAGKSPQASESNAVTPRTRRGTAKIVRTREIIDKVTVEHLGTPPVTTTAEQSVLKRTTMERGRNNGNQAIESPTFPESHSWRRQASSVNNSPAERAHAVEVTYEEEIPIVQEVQRDIGEPGMPLMSTQDYMAEAEELLAHPIDTQEEDALPQGTGASEQAAREAEDRAHLSTGPAVHEPEVAAQDAAGTLDSALQLTAEADGTVGEVAVPVVMAVEATEVELEEPIVEDQEVEFAAEEPAAECGPAGGQAAEPPPASSGLLGSVAHVIQSILHPGARTSNGGRAGAGPTESEEAATMGVPAESTESGLPSALEMDTTELEPEQPAGEVPEEPAQGEAAPPSKRRGRPPSKAKAPKRPRGMEAEAPVSAEPAVAAVSPDAAGEPPEPEAVAEALPEPSPPIQRKGRGPSKKTKAAARAQAAEQGEPEQQAAEEPPAIIEPAVAAVSPDAAGEPPEPEAVAEALPEPRRPAPAKGKGLGRPSKKALPAEMPAEEEAEDGGEGAEREKTPAQIYPPETQMDIQGPRTPAKRPSQPPKPAAEPTPKRRRGKAQEYTAEEPMEEEKEQQQEEGDRQEEEEPEMRVSPRRKPPATAVAQEKAPRSKSSSKAPAAAPPSRAAAPAKSAPAKKTPAKSAPAAKPEKAPSKAAPSKAAPSKSQPSKAAPAQADGGRHKQAPGGRQPAKGAPKKAAGVAPKPKKSRRNENYKTYILKVLKEIHPDESISRKAMDVMDAFAVDMFNRVTAEAARLCRQTNKHTLTSREMETAVRLLFPGELGNHAVSEGRKAVVSGLG